MMDKTKHPEDCQCGNHEAHTEQTREELGLAKDKSWLPGDEEIADLYKKHGWLLFNHELYRLEGVAKFTAKKIAERLESNFYITPDGKEFLISVEVWQELQKEIGGS